MGDISGGAIGAGYTEFANGEAQSIVCSLVPLEGDNFEAITELEMESKCNFALEFTIDEEGIIESIETIWTSIQ